MERVAIIGLSLTEGRLSDLEVLGSGTQGKPCNLHELADELGASELVHIVTCNRVEVVYARESGLPPEPADIALVQSALGIDARAGANLRFLCGPDAVRHLFRVVCSLDSLVLGEDQILAQVRAAHAEAERNGMVGTLLAPVFRGAFQVGKHVRTRTGLAKNPVSVMSLGVHALAEVLEQQGWEEGSGSPRIALVGAGAAAEHAARAITSAGLKVALCANRTAERAEDMASRHGALAVPLTQLTSGEEPLDVLVSATGSPDILFDAATLERVAAAAPGGRGLVGLDLALPRDMATVDTSSKVHVIGLEQLRSQADANRALRAAAAEQAEQFIEARMANLDARASSQTTNARIESFVTASQDLLEGELKSLADNELAGMSESERHRIEQWARSAFARLRHVSTVVCRELGADQKESPSRWAGAEEEETIG